MSSVLLLDLWLKKQKQNKPGDLKYEESLQCNVPLII